MKCDRRTFLKGLASSFAFIGLTTLAKRVEAMTKTRASIWSGQTLTAGAADTSSNWIDLSSAGGANLCVKLTNSAIGPTVAPQVQIWLANNYNGGSPTLPVKDPRGLLKGIVGAANGVQMWSIRIPAGVAAIQLVAGSNTGGNVTVDADISYGSTSLTKSRTSLWSGQPLSAGGSDTNSSWIHLNSAWAAQINFKLTNAGNGPTVPAQVQFQVANDFNSGFPTLPVTYGGAVKGLTSNSEVQYWSEEIPVGVVAVRLVAGSNRGQAVTVDADISVLS
jgi:hypothetical protein